MKNSISLGIIMPLLLIARCFAQNSPIPGIDDYDNTSLPATYQIGGDTTFCKSRSLTIHGEDFVKATGGEAWDTTMVFLGADRIWPTAITTQSNGNNDHIHLTLPGLWLNDTCLLLQIVKRTILSPDTFLYIAKDTICLTGDVAQVNYPGSLFCVGDTNPRPQIVLSNGTTGLFCCPSGAASFAVFPATGEIPLHVGAIGAANQFMYCTTHPKCGDTTVFTIAIEPRQPSTATINGQTAITVCQDSPPIMPDTATLSPMGGVFRSWTGLAILDSLTGEFSPSLSPAGQHGLWYVPGQQCHDSTAIMVMVMPTDTASVGYPSIPQYLGIPTLCDNVPPAWPVFSMGSAGGIFLSSPGGLVIGLNGCINPASSLPGTYSIQYATTGQCPDTVTAIAAVKIDTVVPATFTLPQVQLCASDTLFPQALFGDGLWEVIGNGGQVLHSQTTVPISINATGISPDSTYQLRHVTGSFCMDTATLAFHVLPEDDPTFSYPPSGSFCIGDPDPYPLITGLGGGTFTAVTVGTAVDADGRLHLQASGAGTHTIRYQTNGNCPATFDVPVTIYSTASANFTYAASLFCSADTNPLPQILGNLGGAFTSDTGLVVNPANGEIMLSQSQVGTWNVTYTLVGSCQAQFTQTVQVAQSDTTTYFAYPQPAYCQANADPLPLVVGDTVGSFIAGAGVSFSNTDLGKLDLGAMLPGGPYIVYYDIENRCATDGQDSIWINQPDDPSFTYPQSSYCEGGRNPMPSFVAQPGGTFAEATMNIIFANDSTGEINAILSNQGGPYFIRYTTAGPCPESATFQLSMLPKPYAAQLEVDPDTVYCEGGTVAMLAQTGGVTQYRWWLNGSLVWTQDELYMLQPDPTHPRDTVALVRENVHGCTDSAVVLLRGLAAPHLTARIAGAVTNAFGTTTLTYEVETDQANTTIAWFAEGAGIRPLENPSDTLTPISPGMVATVEVTATVADPYSLAMVDVTFKPLGEACNGQAVTVSDTILPNELPIYVPEVITPDGNTQNDTWMILCQPTIDPAGYRMMLFNGAGGEVMRMEGLHQNFDGGGLPDGVYWWVLTDLSGGEVQNGGLTIRRK